MLPRFLRSQAKVRSILVILVFLMSFWGRAAWAGPALSREVEPNGAIATATAIAGTSAVIEGNVFPNGDIDYYSFTAAAGDRIYAATMTCVPAVLPAADRRADGGDRGQRHLPGAGDAGGRLGVGRDQRHDGR
jgi:hypothetical protein